MRVKTVIIGLSGTISDCLVLLCMQLSWH